MNDHRFLADGRERALEVTSQTLAELKQRIVTSVAAEYADHLAAAGWWEHLYLRAMMARRVKLEFARQREKLAPKGGLYFSNG